MTGSSRIVPDRPDLDRHLAEDDSFQTAFLRCLAAIATSDGTVSLAEYGALNEIAGQIEQSAFAAHALLWFLEHPTDPPAALSILGRASAGVDRGTARAAFKAAQPLLMLQGEESRKAVQRFAKALGVKVTESDLAAFPTGAAPTLWKDVVRRSTRLMKGGTLLPVAEECLKVTREPEVTKMIGAYLDGEIAQPALYARVTGANAAIAQQLVEFERQLAASDVIEQTAQAYVATADELFQQVSQRLSTVEARLQFERANFDEDVEDAIHDAGNAIELEITDRLKTDNWKLAKVWESIGRTNFGKELERRVDRLATRRDQQLRMMKEDLRLFQADLKIVHASILDRQHHTQFARLMPRLRIGTRVANSVDDAASFTLGAGALSVAGAGTAAYVLGTAAVLPVIAPIAPFVGGTVVIAAVVKWLIDAGERKDSEIQHKRKAFEKALRKQLAIARTSYFEQLDIVGEEFRKTADAFLKPALLEAEAARRLSGLQAKIAHRVVGEARQAVARLATAIEQITPNGAE